MSTAGLDSIPWGAIASSGAVGAFLGAAVTHVLAARRDAQNDKRAHTRDIEREQRDRDRADERLREDRVRQRSVVATDLLARIRGHCAEIRVWLLQQNPQTSAWYNANQSLLARANERVVSDGLHEEYPALMDALRYETKSIVIQQKMQDEALPKIFAPDGTRPPGSEIEEHYFRAQSVENVADVIDRYAPLVASYGDPDYAKELSAAAAAFRARAHDMLRRLPNSF